MKRLLLSLLAMVVAAALTGCSPGRSEAVRPTETPVTLPENESGYRLTLAGSYPIENELKQRYQAGEEVTVKLSTVTGQYYVLCVNGEEQQQADMDTEYTYFTFTMPHEDAVISIEEVSVDIPETPPSAGDAVVTVTSGGKCVIPYKHFRCSAEWTGDGFLAADGLGLYYELPILAEEGAIPGLEYAGDISVSYGDNVSFYMLRLYSDSFERLDDPTGIDALGALESGLYYVSIEVIEQGDHIKEADSYENVGWDCVFSLLIE